MALTREQVVTMVDDILSHHSVATHESDLYRLVNAWTHDADSAYAEGAHDAGRSSARNDDPSEAWRSLGDPDSVDRHYIRTTPIAYRQHEQDPW
jgi:hypothetical protein